MSVTKEQIAAYADGELTGAELARVEKAIAADSELAAEVEAQRALRSKLSAHFAPVLEQPVPDRLTNLLKPEGEAGDTASDDGAGVVSFAAERQKRGLAPMVRRWAPIAGPALAASLVLVLWQPWQSGGTPEGYAGEQLASTLDTRLVADQAAGAQTRVLLSFENEAGEYCRAYREGEAGGIACRNDTGWQIEQQFALDGAQVTEFRQAGSEADLLAAAQAMASGGALDAESEAEARERGWR